MKLKSLDKVNSWKVAVFDYIHKSNILQDLLKQKYQKENTYNFLRPSYLQTLSVLLV